MANRLADMHDVGPQLTEAVAKRISSCVSNDRRPRPRPSAPGRRARCPTTPLGAIAGYPPAVTNPLSLADETRAPDGSAYPQSADCAQWRAPVVSATSLKDLSGLGGVWHASGWLEARSGDTLDLVCA